MTVDRKARLKGLAARAGRTKDPVHDGDGATEDNNGTNESAPPRKANIAFRNYAPTDKSLSSQQQQSNEDEAASIHPSASKRLRTQETGTTQPEKITPISSSSALKNALQEAQRDTTGSMQVAATNSTTATPNTTATVTSMAPKKINWDLKRDINDKLAKLERRTQNAIVRILKERLELEAARAVNDDDSDDENGSDLD